VSGVNKVILIGNLGSDPELKHISNGNAVCNFSVATSEKWKDKSGALQEKVEWHRIQCWEKTAENVAKYLTKGSSVYIEGSIHTREYEKDGIRRWATDIKAHSVVFLGGKRDGAAPKADDWSKPADPERPAPPAGDDIPF
jgi:single-strand DNA-binding protein